MANISPTRNNKVGQDKIGQWMIYLAWIALLGLLTLAFNAYLERQNNPNQTPVSTTSGNGSVETRLQRNRYGHYVADGTINGHRVTFMVDTGASRIAIPGSVADAIGLKPGVPSLINTANGSTTAYATRLDSVTLGDIQIRNLRGYITPTLHGDEVLLGMNFLKRLEMIQRGEQLILRSLP